jgi:ATP-dependent helicase YprA (DUF1998 family)
MTQQERSKRARQKWQRLVSEQARSGQGVAAFCRGRGLCEPHFYWWKKRLREKAAAKFVEIKLATGAAGPSTAVDSRIEVRLRNGRSLVVGPGFDAGHLQALLAAVEAA